MTDTARRPLPEHPDPEATDYLDNTTPGYVTLPWSKQVQAFDAELDHDLRHHAMPNVPGQARATLQVVRLLRQALQSKPSEGEG